MSLLFPLPDTKPAVIRALILEDLAGFVYWPQVKHEPQKKERDEADTRHKERRQYAAAPATPTAFGDNL